MPDNYYDKVVDKYGRGLASKAISIVKTGTSTEMASATTGADGEWNIDMSNITENFGDIKVAGTIKQSGVWFPAGINNMAATGKDGKIDFGIAGTVKAVIGLDESTTNDDLVFSIGTTLGTNNAISVDGSSYAVTLNGGDLKLDKSSGDTTLELLIGSVSKAKMYVDDSDNDYLKFTGLAETTASTGGTGVNLPAGLSTTNNEIGALIPVDVSGTTYYIACLKP